MAQPVNTALNNQVAQNVDYDALIQNLDSDTGKQLINKLNQNPQESLRYLTLLKETVNPISSTTDGQKYIDTLASKVQAKYEDVFGKQNIPDAIKKQIDTNPQKYYVQLYNDYHYGDPDKINPTKKSIQRDALSYATQVLSNQNINPDNLVKPHNIVTDGLEFLGNVFSIPKNIIAKGFTSLAGGNPDKVNWWGGSWTDALETINSDNQIKNIIDKKAKNIPLTLDEQDYANNFENKYRWWGLGLDLVADPLNFMGFLTKPFNVAKETYKVAEALKTGDIIKQTAKDVDDLVKLNKITLPETENKIVNKTIDILNTPAQISEKGYKLNVTDPTIVDYIKKTYTINPDQIIPNDLFKRLKPFIKKDTYLNNYFKSKNIDNDLFKYITPTYNNTKDKIIGYKAIQDANINGVKILKDSNYNISDFNNLKNSLKKSKLGNDINANNLFTKEAKIIQPEQTYDVEKYFTTITKDGLKNDLKKILNSEDEQRILRDITNNKKNIKNYNKTPEYIKQLNDLNYARKKKLEKLTNVVDFLKNSGQETEPLYKAINNITNTVNKTDQIINGTNPLQKLARWSVRQDEKFTNAATKLAEATGLRKIFVSDVPKEAKETFDISRQLENEAKRNVLTKLEKLQNHMTNTVIPITKAWGYTEKDAGKVLAKSLENPKQMMDKINSQLKLNKINAKATPEDIEKIVKPLKDINHDYLIEEAKRAGATIVPAFKKEDDINKWSDLAESYRTLYNRNPYNTHLDNIENEMRAMLESKEDIGKQLLTIDPIEAMNDSNYFTHVMTNEGKAFYNQLNPAGKQKMKEIFAIGGISNQSRKERIINETLMEMENKINDIDKYITEHPEDNELKDLYAQWVKYKNKNNIKDADLFESDPVKVAAIRGARMVKTVKQGFLINNLKQFGSTEKIEGWKQLSESPIASLIKDWKNGEKYNLYYHPDVVDAINEVFKMSTSNKALQSILDVFEGVSKIWKSTTLSLVPSTGIRNMIGNIFNLFIQAPTVLKNKAVTGYRNTLLNAFKDAIVTMTDKFLNKSETKLKDYKIVTDSGLITSREKLYNEAVKHGLIHSQIEVEKLNALQGKEKEVKNIGQAVNKFGSNVSGTLYKYSPIAMVGSFSENMTKLAGFMAYVKAGKSYDEAARLIKASLFDYSDITKVEKGLRSVIPFYTWSRKNIPYQIMNIASTPSRVALNLYRIWNRPFISDTEDQRFVSDNYSTSPMLRLPKKGNNIAFTNLEGLIPSFDLTRIFRLINNPKGIFQDLSKDITPLLKTPLELALNKDMLTGGDIKKSRNDVKEFLGMRIDPYLVKALSSIRAFTVADKWIKSFVKGESTPTVNRLTPEEFALSMTLATVYKYDKGISRNISSSQYKKDVMKELIDSKSDINRIKAAVVLNKKMGKDDLSFIMSRMKNNILWLNEGYQKGLITQDERAKYTKQFLDQMIK